MNIINGGCYEIKKTHLGNSRNFKVMLPSKLSERRELHFERLSSIAVSSHFTGAIASFDLRPSNGMMVKYGWG